MACLFTQADHFGIHVGRVDLLFDRNSKKLLRREAICELMDNRFDFDHDGYFTSEIAAGRIGGRAVAADRRIGRDTAWSQSSWPAERRRETDRRGNHGSVDGNEACRLMASMHGTFDDKADLVAGPKTVNDVWNMIPYENYIVTAQLSPEEIKDCDGRCVRQPRKAQSARLRT